MYTYGSGVSTAQFLFQATRVSLGNARLVRIEEADNAAHAQESHNEAAKVEGTLAGADVGILLGTEDTEDFVLLMDRLAKVALLLLVPPAAVGVSESTLLTGRVSVVVVLPG